MRQLLFGPLFSLGALEKVWSIKISRDHFVNQQDLVWVMARVAQLPIAVAPPPAFARHGWWGGMCCEHWPLLEKWGGPQGSASPRLLFCYLKSCLFQACGLFFFSAFQFLKNVPEKEAAILELSEQVFKIESNLAKWAASDDFFFPEIKTKSKNKTKETYAFYFRTVLGLLWKLESRFLVFNIQLQYFTRMWDAGFPGHQSGPHFTSHGCFCFWQCLKFSGGFDSFGVF